MDRKAEIERLTKQITRIEGMIKTIDVALICLVVILIVAVGAAAGIMLLTGCQP